MLANNNLRKFYIGIAVLAAFVLGLQVGHVGFYVPWGTNAQVIEQNKDNGPQSVDWQILWDTINEVNNKYVDRPVDLTELLYGAAQGAVAALGDPYSVFFPPKQADEYQQELKGSFEGIGAEIAIKNQNLVVVTPIEGSPAFKAGLKAGDIIIKVDGESTVDLSLGEAVNRIRGEAGTQVALTVYRESAQDTLDFEITRAAIEVQSVSAEIKQASGKKIGYIKIRRFGEDTQGLFEEAINNFITNGVVGLVIDVRNDPGGYLETAQQLSGYWIEEGKIVLRERFYDGSEKVFFSEGSGMLRDTPTVVLINGGSASASEILSGALRDHKLATLVGDKSFGKGSVQEIINLEGGADLKLTIAKWLTPEGHDLNKDGLEPDEKVELTDEDFNNDRDPQLDRALQLLSE